MYCQNFDMNGEKPVFSSLSHWKSVRNCVTRLWEGWDLWDPLGHWQLSSRIWKGRESHCPVWEHPITPHSSEISVGRFWSKWLEYPPSYLRIPHRWQFILLGWLLCIFWRCVRKYIFALRALFVPICFFVQSDTLIFWRS